MYIFLKTLKVSDVICSNCNVRLKGVDYLLSEVRRSASNIGHPKNQKKKGTSATQIIFHLKMVQESLVPIKADSDLAKKIQKKTHTNKFNFEKTGFWCPKLDLLTVCN